MMGWGSVRTLISFNRQIIKYYVSRKRKVSAPERYDHEKSEKKRYYGKNNYKSGISVNRVNKLTGLLSHNKRNKIILRSSPDNHRNNYVRRN
jgi:hypothetical protein